MIHIIGAGPAGLFLGETIRKQDPTREVVIYEEHDQVGRPVQCTGILTQEIRTLVTLPPTVIANHISKARIYAPDGNHLAITFTKPDVILHRDRFDRWLAGHARKEGCRILKSHRLVSIKNSTLRFTINGGTAEKQTSKIIKLHPGDIVVGCDGPRSTVAKNLGILGERTFGFAIQARMRTRHDNTICFYPGIGTYAWLAPEGSSVARIGVDAERGTKQLFDCFVKRFKGRLIETQAGLIPQFRPGIKKQTRKKGISYFLVGDAAGQVKNTTGGGIIAAMKASRILGRLIAEGREQRYTHALKNDVTRGLYLHYLVNRRLQRFAPEDWNRLIARCNKPQVKKVLENVDRDNIARMLPRLLLREPLLAAYAFH
jgi:digeranylgeranylglycerophospholipid reductase